MVAVALATVPLTVTARGGEGAAGKENCLLLDGDGSTRATCMPVDLKAQGALLVTVPHEELVPLEGPDQMSVGESLGFWWGPDGVISIVVGPSKADTTG